MDRHHRSILPPTPSHLYEHQTTVPFCPATRSSDQAPFLWTLLKPSVEKHPDPVQIAGRDLSEKSPSPNPTHIPKIYRRQREATKISIPRFEARVRRRVGGSNFVGKQRRCGSCYWRRKGNWRRLGMRVDHYQGGRIVFGIWNGSWVWIMMLLR